MQKKSVYPNILLHTEEKRSNRNKTKRLKIATDL